MEYISRNEQTAGSDTQGNVDPRPDPALSTVAGFTVIILIMLLYTMYTVNQLGVNNTGNAADLPNPLVTPLPGNDNLPAKPVSPSPYAPVATPVIISATQTPQPPPYQTPAPQSFITMEPVPVTPIPRHDDLSTSLPERDTSNLITVYSLTSQSADQNMPYVSFNLVNPPLVIDYKVTAMNITDLKDLDYKIISTVYHVKLTINREYEQAWFRVIVRDLDTGRIVLEDSYGKEDGLITSHEVAVYKGGHYRCEFAGDYVTVDLTLKVKKEGNIE